MTLEFQVCHYKVRPIKRSVLSGWGFMAARDLLILGSKWFCLANISLKIHKSIQDIGLSVIDTKGQNDQLGDRRSPTFSVHS